MDSFAGKVAVISGGASGIGFALAKRASGERMKIVLADSTGSRSVRAGDSGYGRESLRNGRGYHQARIR
jgi:NAD(P)-dependent dehydrogenase (short-subunit alcohol dehydrogenase family)